MNGHIVKIRKDENGNERIFLDELLETDKGGKIKSYECGIFCDTE